MFTKLKGHGAWSTLGLRFLILSVVMSVALSFLDGVLHGRIYSDSAADPFLRMVIYWTVDFRYVFENGIYASVVLFVGAKFFETRTVLTVGFDTVDGSKVTVKGPDEEHVVWIGRRYDTAGEAEAVATVIADRLASGAKTD
jgi:hypothetical protein